MLNYTCTYSVHFPAPFPDVSTNKYSEGNTKLLLKFITLNQHYIEPLLDTSNSNNSTVGGLYIDMQVCVCI